MPNASPFVNSPLPFAADHDTPPGPDGGPGPTGFVDPDDLPSFHAADGQGARLSPYTATGDTAFALSDGNWVPIALTDSGIPGSGSTASGGPLFTGSTPHIYDYSGGVFTGGQVPSPASPTTITI